MKPKKYMTLKIEPSKNGFDLKEVDAIPVEALCDLVMQGLKSDSKKARSHALFLDALVKWWKATQQ